MPTDKHTGKGAGEWRGFSRRAQWAGRNSFKQWHVKVGVHLECWTEFESGHHRVNHFDKVKYLKYTRVPTYESRLEGKIVGRKAHFLT